MMLAAKKRKPIVWKLSSYFLLSLLFVIQPGLSFTLTARSRTSSQDSLTSIYARGRVLRSDLSSKFQVSDSEIMSSRYLQAGHGPYFGARHVEVTGDYCRGISHQKVSLECSLAEAKFLNRTLLIDFRMCLGSSHNLIGRDVIKPLGAYFDLENLTRNGYQIAPWHAFLRATEGWNETRNFRVRHFGKFVPVRNLARYPKTSLLVRDGLGFAYHVCRTWQNKEILEPYLPKLQFHPELRYMAATIVETLKRNASGIKGFYGVHVRRGDKAEDKRMWPHLDQDTRPESLLKKLPALIPINSMIYISSDEQKPGFFDPLSKLYTTYTLQDFNYLWADGSRWHQAYKQIFRGTPFFDGYMQGIVDYSVLAHAMRVVETFNDLTKDKRTGEKHKRKPSLTKKAEELPLQQRIGISLESIASVGASILAMAFLFLILCVRALGCQSMHSFLLLHLGGTKHCNG